MKNIKHISLILLAAVYLSAACAATVSLVLTTYSGSGNHAYESFSGQTKDIPTKSYVQRRHIPLVKNFTLPMGVASSVVFPSAASAQHITYKTSFVHTHQSCYFSSLCGRAPPVA